MNNEKILAHVRMFVLREKLLCPGEPLHLAAAVSTRQSRPGGEAAV